MNYEAIRRSECDVFYDVLSWCVTVSLPTPSSEPKTQRARVAADAGQASDRVTFLTRKARRSAYLSRKIGSRRGLPRRRWAAGCPGAAGPPARAARASGGQPEPEARILICGALPTAHKLPQGGND